eukprot:7651157-Pyramimonas_sp.AAC.1
MTSSHWKARAKVDVTRGHLIDALCQCDCFGHVGSGGSPWDIQASKGSNFSRDHISGLVDGPQVQARLHFQLGNGGSSTCPWCAPGRCSMTRGSASQMPTSRPLTTAPTWQPLRLPGAGKVCASRSRGPRVRMTSLASIVKGRLVAPLALTTWCTC